jgi:hypothetical protein
MNRLQGIGTLASRSLALAALLGLAGCSSSLKESTSLPITNAITRVTDASGTIEATLRSGAAPAASGGPTVTASGIAVMINGGSSQQSLVAGAAFSTVYVSVPGLSGYYELTLPAAAAAAGIVVVSSQDLNGAIFPVNYAVESGGAVGPAFSQNMRVIHVGSGDVQVSVSWTGLSDVDLHVVDPNGEEVYYANRTSASGGTLDLDSNPACSIDSVNNENIVWPTGKGLHGVYTVRVDLYAACGVPQSDYIVTVQTKGGTPQIFSGSLTVAQPGGAGAGIQVTQFTY